MKTTGLLLLMLGCVISASAQDDDYYSSNEIKTVLGSSPKVTGFGSLEIKATEIKNDLVVLPGFTGGMILNKHFIFGLGGYGLATEVDFMGIEPATRQYLYGGYGGLVIGGVIAPKEIIHVYFPVLLGAGGAYVTEKGFNDWDDFHHEDEFDESTAFYVVEPGVELEVNIARFFRIGMGASYRFVRESKLVNVSDSDLSNYSANLSLKFGNF